ncbi:hypothetical protein [Maribacter polysaccharolyticus]|uniref:hypothetical protein n=1 Tax=Maribacter polysaccharolyticus TaxID=3020831 RepID=UPI00237F867D|nr:hypothetical protein [Maribacter polysaccharolyticus]MDE3742515.1 hypothetical protein [Maribacter polysaccharolyticus]
MEPLVKTGLDIQVHDSSNSYQSLYVFKNNTEFTIVSNGNRKTGQLSAEDHSGLFELLSKAKRKTIRKHSILGSDTLTYPYVSIRERGVEAAFGSPGFFVVLPLGSDNHLVTEVTTFINYLFAKYL